MIPDAQAAGPTFTAYRSYLVRFWQSNAQGDWRASAHCVQTGNTVMFGEIAQLLAFLQTEIKYSEANEGGTRRLPTIG